LSPPPKVEELNEAFPQKVAEVKKTFSQKVEVPYR
jgi:hypothetical protein